jgi:hypothetical protein
MTWGQFKRTAIPFLASKIGWHCVTPDSHWVYRVGRTPGQRQLAEDLRWAWARAVSAASSMGTGWNSPEQKGMKRM